MHKLIRFWHKNKMEIIKIISIAAFIYVIILIINHMIKEDTQNQLINYNTNINNNETNSLSEENKKGLKSNISAITGNTVEEKQLKNAIDIIYDFVNYCNEQDYENAYNLISENCKNQMFKSIDVFKESYYKDVFNGQKKNCVIENWSGDTYKVDLKEDILATGKDSEYTKQDYITIVQNKGEYKLNINNYIGFYEINKTTKKDNISIDAVSKNVYKDYEEYTVKVTNNTDKILQLDDVKNTDTLYLEDKNEVKYYYYNHELTNQTLTVTIGQTKEITIKFYSKFVSTKKIKNIVFSKILLINKQDAQQIKMIVDI